MYLFQKLIQFVPIIALCFQHQVQAQQMDALGYQTKSKTDILKVLHTNSESFKTESVEQMLSTISTKCPSYEPTKKLMSDLFKNYDLEVTVLKREVLSINQDQAEVKELIRVKKKAGTKAFQDNETLTKSVLIYDETGWKLCSTSILDIKYLKAKTSLPKSKQAKAVSPKIAQSIMKVLRNNSNSFESENMALMMSTISKKCPAYGATKKMMTDLFKMYDLEVSVLKREILSVQENQAEVKELIRVKKKAGVQAFQDNETLSKSSLIHDGNGWKICSTEILNIKYLSTQ